MGQKRYEFADARQGQGGRSGGAVPTLAAYLNYYAFGLLQPGRYAPGNTSTVS